MCDEDAATVSPWLALPRPRRRNAEAEWSLARQLTNWTGSEERDLRLFWPKPELQTEEIAAWFERSVQAIRAAASRLNLGERPREQTNGSKTRGVPKPPRKPKAAKQPDAGPPLLQTVDGVVLTPRVTKAWDRVEVGEAVADVLADMRLPAIEAQAVRRWARDGR